MRFIENRKVFGKIYIAEQENVLDSPVCYAAKELRYYFSRMSAAVVEIVGIAEGENLNIQETGCSVYLGKTSGLDSGDLGDDGFVIESNAKGLFIAGGKRGVIYGVYEFLEHLGCRFFTPTCEKIPTLPTLDFPEFHTRQKPIITYREHNYVDVRDNPRFAVKCRLNGSHHPIPERLGGHLSYAWFVHTFENMVPTTVYGKDHPEYFAVLDGKRCTLGNGRTQLCLSNPAVLDIAIEAVRKRLRECPECKIISVSQNDWRVGCECEPCRKIDKEEGSPSGTLLRFVNAIAEALEPEFPDVLFDTLAYNYTRPAPKITRNRKNVCVRLCSIECCFAHSYETCDDTSRGVILPDGTKHRFIEDLQDWGKICDNMFIWDYTTCFAHYPKPNPNWRVLQPNIQTMVKNNVKGVFEQANGSSHGGVDFNELRLYLISKLLWNPDCDLAKHRQEFLEEYYGAAAEDMAGYLDYLCDVTEKEHCHVGYDDHPTHAFLDEKYLAEYEKFFDAGAKKVAGDALRLARVEKNRLSIRWCEIKRKTMLRGEFDPEEINRFFADWRGFNLTRIDEWANFETTLRALLDQKWRGIEYFEHWTGEEPELM